MRVVARLSKSVLFGIVSFVTALPAEQGTLTFVFGPSSQEAARQSARAAAATARHWLQTDGGSVEIRRAGSPDAQGIDLHMDARQLEQAFIDTALAARDADPPSFLMTLDSAAQAAALRPGTRIVIAVLNSPPFSSDAERGLEHLAEICQANSVRVVVLDAAEGPKIAPNAALQALTTKSGGVWVRQAKALEPEVEMVAPADESTAPPARRACSTRPCQDRRFRNCRRRSRPQVRNPGTYPVHAYFRNRVHLRKHHRPRCGFWQHCGDPSYRQPGLDRRGFLRGSVRGERCKPTPARPHHRRIAPEWSEVRY